VYSALAHGHSLDSDRVVNNALVLDTRKGFTISVWIKFAPKDGERSTGDIVSIESPSLSSPIFSAWVEFPEQAIHYSCAQDDIDISRSVRTGVKIPKTAFHLAIVYDCSTFTFYINGEKRKTIPESSPLPDPQSVCVKIN
jgi:hypothetical protein